MKIEIPQLSDEELEARAKRIKPIMRKDGIAYFIKPGHMRNESYIWSPEFESPAPDMVSGCDIKTYHTFSYYGFFKPTVAEVLSQIPDEHVKDACAFEILRSPKWAADLNVEREATNQGFHVATTRLYWAESNAKRKELSCK